MHYLEAKHMFPSGVTHDTRYLQPFPIFVAGAKGPRKWDLDENEYVDYVMGHGALLLGHAHPQIVAAVTEQLQKGTHLGANTLYELEWAQAVQKLMPGVEKIRFHSSGTEATLMALRLARAYTGRNKIVKFQDHFHGWHDCAIWQSGRYSTAGIPQEIGEFTTVIQAETAAVEQALSQGDVAAVILEPTGARMGSLPLGAAFVRQLRELTSKHGVLLIFDEVVTGFRISSGGAQERLGIRPDLTALAKILAGGLPGGAVGGRAEIVDLIAFHDDPAWDTQRRVGHPGTFNANPLSAAAGTRCLELIASDQINAIADAAAHRLKTGINQAFADGGVSGGAYGIASLVWFLFGVTFEESSDELEHSTIREAFAAHDYRLFKRALINEGIDIMGQNAFIVSGVHHDDDVEDTLSAFQKALAKYKREKN